MTQTPEFETFSQMLDNEESLQGFELTDDQTLLVDLRKVLREDTERVRVPKNFAQETAKAVTSRYQKLSRSEKLLDFSRQQLTESVFRRSGPAKGLGLAAVGVGLAAASFKALAAYGGLLLIFSLLWLGREMKAGSLDLGRSGTVSGASSRAAGILFYTLPALAVIATAVVASAVVGMLGVFSLTFRGNAAGMLVWVQLLVGIGTAILLTKACLPYWKAYRDRAATHPGRLAYFQTLHAAWLSGLLVGVAGNVTAGSEHQRLAIDHFFFAGLLFLVVLWSLSVAVPYRYSHRVDAPADFGQARRTFAGSLLFGFLPILLALVGFYQMHLTREIKDPSYEFRVADVNAWYADQKAIPEEQNGYVSLRPFLVMTEQDKPKNAVVAEGLRSLGEFHAHESNSYKLLDPAQRLPFQEKKADFLAQLPKIEAALEKPHYSTAAVEGFSYQSLAPNFITYRAVTQGLSLLTQEALENGQTQEAVEYAVLGLRWAGKTEAETLIGEMVKIAQLNITLADLEEPIASGRFDRAELEQLSAALEKARPRPNEFVQVMNRETVMADKAFRQFLIDGDVTWEELDNVGIPPIMSLFPTSYWESERKAYWNYQLAQSTGWSSLSNPQFELANMVNPMNVGAESLTPNTARAMLHFCALQSKFSALLVMCELEKYKLKRGMYPESLNFLARQAPHPADDMTRDAMDTRPSGKKARFGYTRTPHGYQLTSESPWYQRLDIKNPQVYGPGN